MNLGRRRLTNDELRGHFEGLGFEAVATFLASGNVVFETSTTDAVDLVEPIESGLRDALSYSVPTFLRSEAEVRAIAAFEPFTEEELAASSGKAQVALLNDEPSEADRRRVLELSTDDDRLALRGSELYWLPHHGISGSQLDFGAIERSLGATTVRTQRTIRRLAEKHLEE